jgi:hypothetical protein
MNLFHSAFLSGMDDSLHLNRIRFIPSLVQRWRLQRQSDDSTNCLRHSTHPQLALDSNILRLTSTRLGFCGNRDHVGRNCYHDSSILQSRPYRWFLHATVHCVDNFCLDLELEFMVLEQVLNVFEDCCVTEIKIFIE